MSHKTILDLMREGGFNPKAGKPVPIELIYQSNTISEAEYKAEVERQRLVYQASVNSAAISDMELQAEALNDRAIRAGVPSRFLKYAIDLTHIDDLNAGRGVYFMGDQGTHKTTVACSMLRGWLRDNPFGTARFIRATSLIDEFNDAYSLHKAASQVMSEYALVGLLLIDDIGKEVPTARAVSHLWELIDRRYGEGRPTIITTQFGPEELANRLSEGGGAESALAIMRRLGETFLLFDMGS